MVGTFYLSSSPEAAPFVKVGDQVGADTTVCIIEAMKGLQRDPGRRERQDLRDPGRERGRRGVWPTAVLGRMTPRLCGRDSSMRYEANQRESLA